MTSLVKRPSAPPVPAAHASSTAAQATPTKQINTPQTVHLNKISPTLVERVRSEMKLISEDGIRQKIRALQTRKRELAATAGSATSRGPLIEREKIDADIRKIRQLKSVGDACKKLDEAIAAGAHEFFSFQGTYAGLLHAAAEAKRQADMEGSCGNFEGAVRQRAESTAYRALHALMRLRRWDLVLGKVFTYTDPSHGPISVRFDPQIHAGLLDSESRSSGQLESQVGQSADEPTSTVAVSNGADDLDQKASRPESPASMFKLGFRLASLLALAKTKADILHTLTAIGDAARHMDAGWFRDVLLPACVQARERVGPSVWDRDVAGTFGAVAQLCNSARPKA